MRRDGDAARLTVAAPPLNLYDLEMHGDLDRALDEIEADPPRVLVIGAEGKVVSAGVDVSIFAAQADAAAGQVLFDRMLELPDRIAALPFPTVFAAHGLCLTWAFEVALACDLVVASEKARFGLVERVIGLTPTMGGTQRLAARAGVGRAKELVMTGDLYDAETLSRWDVVNRVWSVEDFDAELDALVTHLATGPTRAFAAAKQVLDAADAGGVAGANAEVTRIAAALYDTADMQGGMASFLADGPGKATFSGR
ncbi:enoyl-CoA hydratase/isomerase family protein [Solicola sp. PLA-1-18]|uniref:enoyl-CoA hydratase/isomerase family protein n=1 Tax=Solicola sp. PLA-1-18 TaxID=3380532 RepID=UPI003B7FACA0